MSPVTPERYLLAAIIHSMGPKQRARLLQTIGDVEPENVVQLRRSVSTAQRNQIVRECRTIAGER